MDELTPPNRPGQGGFSLVEVLLAVVITGLIISGIIAGLLITARTSASTRNGSRASSALAAAVGVVRTQPYGSCASVSDLDTTFRASGAPVASDVAVRIDFLSVRQWDRASSAFGPAGASCTSDSGALLISLRATVEGETATGEVVQRNPRARP